VIRSYLIAVKIDRLENPEAPLGLAHTAFLRHGRWSLMVGNRKGKRAYHHGDLRRALLDEALRCVEREGLPALSLRELALRLGVSPAAPYHHFPDRKALLHELSAQGFAGLEAAMESEVAKVGSGPEDRLGALGRAYVRFALAHPGHFQVMFHPEAALPPNAGDAKEGRTFELLTECVTACLAAAGHAGQDPLPAVVAMWGAVHGVAKLYLEGPLGQMLTPAEFEQVAEQANRILRSALTSPDREAFPGVPARPDARRSREPHPKSR
jgi:AcrR family transcriptional regulator